MADLSKAGLRAAAQKAARGGKLDGTTQAALDRATSQSGGEGRKLNTLLGGGKLTDNE